MRHEGLKSAIFVAEAPGRRTCFSCGRGFVDSRLPVSSLERAFRPDILPEDTPDVEEHWVHVIEKLKS